MSAPSIRLLAPEELRQAVGIVAHGMLASSAEEVLDGWAQRMSSGETHGAFDDGELVGVARWFPSEVSVPGGATSGGCVTAVAVLPTHRRRGHLRRLMDAQLASMRERGVAVGLLVAAEWPIYGRYGYGPAVEACTWRLSTKLATFRAAPAGRVRLVSPEEIRPHLESLHDDAVWARSPAAVTRAGDTWDGLAGLVPFPGQKDDPGLIRAALWSNDEGEVDGAVVYRVESRWADAMPQGRAEVVMLLGRTPTAERELWRHLCELDWVTTVTAPERGVDDPLPYFLVNGRAAVAVDRADCIWARLLDLPAALGARRSPVAGACVVEVTDDLGYAAGRWALELGPTSSSASPTTAPGEITLSVAVLSAAYFGGQSLVRLHQAGWLDELAPGAVERLDALLRSSMAPWSPTTY